MNNGFLSQEEIDALLGGDGGETEESAETVDEVVESNSQEELDNVLTEIEKDILGEVGNISMGSASTALSQIIGQKVNITTPVVCTTNLKNIKDNFATPNIALDVKYTSGIVGSNLLLMRVNDAAVVANLMMGGDGIVGDTTELSEIEISAVSEAMNQMIGSAATSMATMFAREVNISPPDSKVCDDSSEISTDLSDEELVVQTSFNLQIGDLVDSYIMQILPIKTGRKIISIMMGTDVEEVETIPEKGIEKTEEVVVPEQPTQVINDQVHNMSAPSPAPVQSNSVNQNHQIHGGNESVYMGNAYDNMTMQQPSAQPVNVQPVNVQQASFQPLVGSQIGGNPQNIDLILDVPLQVSVVLGRSKMNIKDVLELGSGSLIELDKLTEEPVEVLINGKKVAYGEVVVVDENFGVRITSIVSNEDRIRSLGK